MFAEINTGKYWFSALRIDIKKKKRLIEKCKKKLPSPIFYYIVFVLYFFITFSLIIFNNFEDFYVLFFNLLILVTL